MMFPKSHLMDLTLYFLMGHGEKLTFLNSEVQYYSQDTFYYRLFSLLAPSYSPQTDFPFSFEGRVFASPNKGAWVVNESKLERLEKTDRLQPEGNNLSYQIFFDDFPFKKITSSWQDAQVSYEKVYVVQTAPSVIARCMLLTTDPGDLVLDPTCGSGTTAYVAEQWGRRWITVDTSRVAIALARTRLMAARYPYYLLADSPEGSARSARFPSPKQTGLPGRGRRRLRERAISKKASSTSACLTSPSNPSPTTKRSTPSMPVTRSSLSRCASRLTALAGKDWQEWEISRELPLTLALSQGEKEQIEGLLAEYWCLRRERQKEIDASIARRADTELLYDQPYEDNKRIRVAGPFTVESLSPHRVLSTDAERPASEVEGQQQSGAGQFEAMIIENLRSAGVQNRVKNERLKFTRLESYAGTWLHATGEYEESRPSPHGRGAGGEGRAGGEGEVIKRVAITIGPEHGTVGPELIKDAAKEAVQGIGFDLLVVLGFAFDPHVSEEIKRYGKLTVLPARMNPDLAMGAELLKKTGAGNLFMVFGEPDVEVVQSDGKVTVAIRGVDVYDPTTGEIRSASTDDIACWFIDTNYNGESFFVRHAYFTGADEPYEKLKRALRAEIDEAAWSALYSTTSYPFDPPETGKIAVKVINHYGDEVMKVYEVATS